MRPVKPPMCVDRATGSVPKQTVESYLATTHHVQGRDEEDLGISIKVLDLRREVLGEKHPDTIRSMADLATTYHTQGRYEEAEGIKIKPPDPR